MSEHDPAARHGSATDVGLVRTTNEDSHLAQPPVFAVADGMGGHSGGDVASRIAVEELARLAGPGSGVPPAPDVARGRAALETALARAQRRLQEHILAQRETRPGWYAGTTVVAALLVEAEGGPAWVVANLGDSRAYALADGELRRVTTDHSVVQELLDAGRITPEQAAVHPERNVITRALGGAATVGPDVFVLPVDRVDRLLLCSDGVTGMLDDAVLAEVLAGADRPQEAADRLVRLAVEAGGVDNATAVVVDPPVSARPAPRSG